MLTSHSLLSDGSGSQAGGSGESDAAGAVQKLEERKSVDPRAMARFQTMVLSKVERAKHYPPDARHSGVTGDVRVSFRIARATLPDNDPNDPTSPYYDLCYDSWLPNGNWQAGVSAWPPVYGDLLDTVRHSQGQNVLFMDGHAKWMKWEPTVSSQADNMHDLH